MKFVLWWVLRKQSSYIFHEKSRNVSCMSYKNSFFLRNSRYYDTIWKPLKLKSFIEWSYLARVRDPRSMSMWEIFWSIFEPFFSFLIDFEFSLLRCFPIFSPFMCTYIIAKYLSWPFVSARILIVSNNIFDYIKRSIKIFISTKPEFSDANSFISTPPQNVAKCGWGSATFMT